MAFVRVKGPIPPGSDNYYRYLVKSERVDGQVTQKQLQYLGPADGPNDTKYNIDEIDDEYRHLLTETQRGHQNQEIKYRFSTDQGDIEVWMAPGIRGEKYKEIKDDINEWSKGNTPEIRADGNRVTKNQLDDIKRIEIYEGGSYSFSAGNKEYKSAAHYNHEERAIRIFDIDMNQKHLTNHLSHEAGHNTFARLKKKKREQKTNYNELVRMGVVDSDSEKELKEKAPAYHVYKRYREHIEERGKNALITDYAQSFWEDYEKKDGAKQYSKKNRAMDENMAEFFEGESIPSGAINMYNILEEVEEWDDSEGSDYHGWQPE